MSKKFYLAAAVLMCLAVFGTLVPAQSSSSSNNSSTDRQSLAGVSPAEAKAWQEDLRYLAAEAPKWHKNLFHTITPAQFQSAVNRLHERISNLARHEIIIEMARIMAMIGDGHTNIAPTRDPKVGFRSLPLKLYLFRDGLFVRAASRENAELVGSRVVKIGNLTTEDAIKRAGEIVGVDNEMNIRFFAPHLLAMPEILHALKITDTLDSVAVTVRQRSGKEQTVDLKQFGAPELLPPDTDTSWVNREGWVDMRDGATAQSPLWLKKDPNDKFWFELLPDSRTIYVQMNQVLNKENETIEAFAKRLFAFAEKNGVEKMIFDVRLNRGGNNVLLRPLLLEAVRSKVNQPGKLFVIMGRSTWSAAQFFVNDFEKYTNAVFIGEPSGSKGNHYADSRRITLPNSGITARVSIYYWQDWAPWDTRVWTTPDTAAELTSDDYRNNVDPAVNLALNYVPRPKLSELLNEALTRGGVDLAVKSFREFKADPLNKFAATEEPLLIAGDRLLEEKKPEQALILFKLNLEENPKPARGYFALGEAYLQMSNKEQAIKYFEKALELDPKYYIANERLKTARKN